MTVRLLALTIHAPYAGLILSGRKQYETRGWSTPHRGLVAIHEARPRRAIIGVVRLVDVVRVDTLTNLSAFERSVGDFSSGRYAWKFTDARRLSSPVQHRGVLRLWEVDPILASRILRALNLNLEGSL